MTFRMGKSLVKAISLILAAALLAALVSCTPDAPKPDEGEVTVDIAAPTPEPTPAPTPTPSPTPEPTPTPSPTPEPPPVRGTMMFVGDIMCLSAQQYCAMNQAKSGQKFDFTPSFEYVRPLLKKADCAVGNLETVLSPSSPYSYQQTHVGNMPNCNAPAVYLSALKYAGFDAFALANNHSIDAGINGMTETLDALDAYSIPGTGVFRSADDKHYIMLDVNGIKVALLSYTELYNSRYYILKNAGKTYMINSFSEAAVRSDVLAAKAAGAEFIVAYNHWDIEHQPKPMKETRVHAQMMANAGVDLIIGSHSHCLQPSVWLTANDGRRVLCMYSMGNFVSSMARDTANDTVILEVKLLRAPGGAVTIEEEIFHPCRVIQKLNGKAFVVVPTATTTIPSIKTRLKEAEARITKILNSER